MIHEKEEDSGSPRETPCPVKCWEVWAMTCHLWAVSWDCVTSELWAVACHFWALSYVVTSWLLAVTRLFWTVFCHLWVLSWGHITSELWAVSCHLWAVSCVLSPLSSELWPVTCEVWVEAMSPLSCEWCSVTSELWVVSCHFWAVSCDLPPLVVTMLPLSYELRPCHLWTLSYHLWTVNCVLSPLSCELRSIISMPCDPPTTLPWVFMGTPSIENPSLGFILSQSPLVPFPHKDQIRRVQTKSGLTWYLRSAVPWSQKCGW